MKKYIPTVKYLVILNTIQLLLLGMCLYMFSSKINVLPWYSPLTSYMLLDLIILFGIQLIMMFHVWFMKEKYELFKIPTRIAIINTLIILFVFFISIVSVLFFNILTIIFTFIEIGLLVYIVHFIRGLLKIYK